MAPAPPAGRDLDIVVWGATGFVGNLVCAYLAENARGARWAAAGRSKEKVEKTLKELGIKDKRIIVAGSDDEKSLVEMVTQTKVVIALVGPYALYGKKLVKACAENHTHYLDLTGETTFAAEAIQALHRQALIGRAIIVHSCGMDSIPSDYGAYLAIKALRQKHGESTRIGKVKASYRLKDAPSGGTFLSVMNLLEQPMAVMRELQNNPYILSPLPGHQKASNKWVTKLPDGWGGIFVMAVHNNQIVRRTWGLFESTARSGKDMSYGRNFEYEEYLGFSNPIYAFLVSFFVSFGSLFLVLVPGLLKLIKLVGPKSGSGPSKKQLENGYLKVVTTAWSEDGKHSAQAVIRGKGSPGYALTAKMIAEFALVIINDYERLPVLAREGGPLTTVTAGGDAYIERLVERGVFQIEAKALDGDEDDKSK